MKTDEGVRSSGMPNLSLSWVAVMADPHVGWEVLQLVVLNNFISVADDLENHHVLAMRKNERFLIAKRSVKFSIKRVTVLIYEFVLCNLVRVNEACFLHELCKNFFFDSTEVPAHLGRFHL